MINTGDDMVDKLKIIELDISKIIQYENNAKLHPETQIEQIANSIKQFGFNDPIAIDDKNVIIEGHGRYLAALKLGMQKIPCIVLSHLTAAKKKAYIIAHNKLTTSTGYDEEKLMAEIEAIKLDDDFDFDLSEIGIDIPNFETPDIIYSDVGDAQATEKMAGTHIPVRVGRLLMFIDESKDKKRADKIWELFFKKYEKMSDSEKATLEEKITVALNEISLDY